MADANLHRNQPLARAAVWFLTYAGIVLVVVCFALFHADMIEDDFNHRALLRIGLIASVLLFSLLALTSSALGFLANCRLGRLAGTFALIVLVLGLMAIAASYDKAMLHAVG